MVTKKFLKSTLALTLAATFPTFCLPANGQSSKTSRRGARDRRKSRPSLALIAPSWIPRPTHAPISISLPAASSRRSIPFPGDLPLYDQFENLDEYNRQLLHGILEQASTQTSGRSSDEQKIGDYYASCMNTSAINADGLKPLQPELDRIDALKDKKELPALLAHYQKISVNAFFDLGSMQDFKDATKEIAVRRPRRPWTCRKKIITFAAIQRACSCGSSICSTSPICCTCMASPPTRRWRMQKLFWRLKPPWPKRPWE